MSGSSPAVPAKSDVVAVGEGPSPSTPVPCLRAQPRHAWEESSEYGNIVCCDFAKKPV